METEEVVSNMSEDEKKRTKKCRRDAEIVPTSRRRKEKNSKVMQHKKEPETKTKLRKGRVAAHVSSSSVPKSRFSVRMSKSECDVQRSEAVETKWKGSSPLEELVRVDCC